MLVEIKNKLVSTDVFTEQFVCDLSKCKGACCVQGDGGAPLEQSEVELIKKNVKKIKPYMNQKGIDTIDEQGFFYQDDEEQASTQLVNKKECAFVYFDKSNTAQCSIETAYKDDAISFNKPISCHLYPIRTKDFIEFTAINYETWDICSPACDLGSSLKVPVFKFLKDPLIRAYGAEFFEELERVNEELKLQNK